jgi:hypothetical protein
MIPLSAASSSGLSLSNLTWSRSSRGYELKLNDTVAGTLERPSFWSSKIVATTASGTWLFRRAGFFNVGAEILDSTTQQLIATLKTNWGGRGTLTFNDGQTFFLESRGIWRPVWNILTPDGQPVLQVHKREKTVEVVNGTAAPGDRLALLILFMLYRIWIAEQDSSAAVVVATS